MSWTLVASTLSGAAFAEIENATSREISNLLGRTNTVRLTLPAASPITPQIASTNVLIDAYDGADHRFRGRVISYNRVSNDEGRSLAVVAADPSWVFPKRLIGKSAAGYVQGSMTDRGATTKTLIDAVNAERNTFLRIGSLPYLSGSTSTYSSGPFKPLSEAVADLSAGVYGFDWTVEPLKGVDQKYGDWRAAPLFGTFKPDVVFYHSHGAGGNMKSVTDTVEKTTQANRVYHFTEFGVDAPGALTVTSVTDSTTQNTIDIDGLYEDLAVAQLTDVGLRQQLVDAHVALRRFPRRVIQFESQEYDPTNPGDTPRFGVDFDIGDIVRGRAEDEHGLWFDAYFRVYGWTAKPDNLGKETGSVQLVADGVGQAGVNA